jgi:hypothetical protein
MSFSEDWLALRAAADDRARSGELIATAADDLERRRANPGVPVRIVDLGAGTGATLSAIAPHLPRPQGWLLVDGDPHLLHAAETRLRAHLPADVALAVQEADLAATPTPWHHRPDLVTASALFDLASKGFIEALARRLQAEGVPLLAMLTYDGRLELAPGHPHDRDMVDAFNAHQKGYKSFGPAAGPDASSLLRTAFEQRGFAVEERDTAWVLERPRDETLMRAKLQGWAEAARALRPDDAVIEDWLADRLAECDRIVVGHRDLLALPR